MQHPPGASDVPLRSCNPVPPACRYAVVGCSGAGKSTLARQIAACIGAPHIELDAIYHGPNWSKTPDEAFLREVQARCAAPRWVADGNYSVVRPVVWARAEVVVFIDLPRPLVMRQVVLRTLRRVILRTPLWNGNRERIGNFLHWDPRESIILWSWTRHQMYVDRYTQAMLDPSFDYLRFVRLRSHAEIKSFLTSIGVPAGCAAPSRADRCRTGA